MNILSRVKACVQMNKDLIKELKENSESSWLNSYLYSSSIYNKANDCYIYKNDAIVLKHLMIPSTYPGILLAKTTKGECYILVNTSFLNIKQEYQDAVVAHELGHKYFNHLDNVDQKFLYLIKRALGFSVILNTEYEADSYSLSKGFKIKETLNYFKSLHVYNNKELNLRIKALSRIGD